MADIEDKLQGQTKAHLRDILIDLLMNDEDVQYAVKEALEEQKRRDEWAEASAWV